MRLLPARRWSPLLPPGLLPGTLTPKACPEFLQVPTAQTGWRREGNMRILSYSSLQSVSLQKSLIRYCSSTLPAPLTPVLQLHQQPPAGHDSGQPHGSLQPPQSGVGHAVPLLCAGHSSGCTGHCAVVPGSSHSPPPQVSLALTWIYFRLDNSYFSLANIHFIPEVGCSIRLTNTYFFGI